MPDISDDVIGAVARGIYKPVFAAQLKEGTAVGPAQLPPEALAFLRVQARHGLEALRQCVTDDMVAAAAETGCCRAEDAREIFAAMLDQVLGEKRSDA